jgi:hypothetical protein
MANFQFFSVLSSGLSYRPEVKNLKDAKQWLAENAVFGELYAALNIRRGIQDNYLLTKALNGRVTVQRLAD